MESESIKPIGSPTRYQCRVTLGAVGEEWDGTFKPLAELSDGPPPETRDTPEA